MYTEILKEMDIDPQPFNMARLVKFQEYLCIEIAANNLTGVTAERNQGPPKTSNFTRSATGKGAIRRMAKLEQKIARLEAPSDRPIDRQTPQGNGDYSGGACLVCGSPDHPAAKCPNTNRGAVLALEKSQRERAKVEKGRTKLELCVAWKQVMLYLRMRVRRMNG